MEIRKFRPTDMKAFPDLMVALRAEGVKHILGPCYTVTDEHGIVAIGGLGSLGGGTCEAWFQCRLDLNGQGRELVWTTRKMIRDLMQRYGFQRAQAKIQPQNEVAIRFVRAMGFTKEGTMRGYWHGEDRDLYARIR